MAISPLAGTGGGPTLWMSVAARDRTGRVFDNVTDKIDKVADVSVRALSKIGNLSMSIATLGSVTGLLNEQQARAIGIFGTIIQIFTTGYYVAKSIATAITWAHAHALTWEVSLMTKGIGVAIAAAAAIGVIALMTREATVAQEEYNVAIERGTQVQEQRRTASRNLVRRGEFEEVIA